MKIVRVDWVDSSSVSGRPWVDMEDLRREPNLECITIGCIVRESKTSVTIASSFAYGHDGQATQAIGDITIPKVAIKKRRILR